MNITNDTRQYLQARIFAEKMLNPFVFQEAQQSLEGLMGGEILKHFITSNLFRVNVSKEEMDMGIREVHNRTKAHIEEQSFVDEELDFLVAAEANLGSKSVESTFLQATSRLGKNMFTCTIVAQALPILQEQGAIGSAECLVFGNRLLASSLYLASLVFMCNKIVPAVAQLLKYDPKLQKRIFLHAASLFPVFNANLNKPCPFVYEEFVLLANRKKKKKMERLKQLVRMTGPGNQLKSASLLFDSALLNLHRPMVAEKQIMGAFLLLSDFLILEPRRGLLAPSSLNSNSFCNLFLLIFRSIIALKGLLVKEAVNRCESVFIAPCNSYVAFECAKYYDFHGDSAGALRNYQRVLKYACENVQVTRSACLVHATALVRILELTKKTKDSKDLVDAATTFIRGISAAGIVMDEQFESLLNRASACDIDR